MKLNFHKHITERTISNIIVILCGVIGYFILRDFSRIWGTIEWFFSLLTPFILGFIFAYLLNNFLIFSENHILRPVKHFKLKRTFSVILSLIFAFIILGILFQMLIPQLMESVMMLVDNIPTYIKNLTLLATDLTNKYNIDPKFLDELFSITADLQQTLPETVKNFALTALDMSAQLVSIISKFIIALIISVYFLYNKELFCAQIKKILCSILSKEHVNIIVDFTALCNKIFNGFITGKLLDSLIIGIICFIGMTIFGFPYVLLISVIIGVTNIIPFFGPIIGAIPATFILLIADPMKALLFPLFIIVLQQLDGNIIGPKILGDSTGISAIWVMFAILIGGGMFGFIGMIVGVPTLAVIFAILKGCMDNSLKKKNLSLDTVDYSPNKNAFSASKHSTSKK